MRPDDSAIFDWNEFRFAWPIASDGYVWRDDVEPFRTSERPLTDSEEAVVWGGGPYLTWPVPYKQIKNAEVELYSPLNHITSSKRSLDVLHRQLSLTAPNVDSVEKFASEWGLLSPGALLASNDGELWLGESHYFWFSTIARLFALTTLFDRTKPGFEQPGFIGKFIKWQRNQVSMQMYVKINDGELQLENKPKIVNYVAKYVEVLARKGDSNGLFETWKPGDVIEPMRYFAAKQLRNETMNRLTPTFDVTRNDEFLLVPDSLRTALFMKVVFELSGRLKESRICPTCGNPFVPKRPDQLRCGVACRRKAYRQRKADEARSAKNGEK